MSAANAWCAIGRSWRSDVGPDAYLAMVSLGAPSDPPPDIPPSLELAHTAPTLSVWRARYPIPLPVRAITPSLVLIGEVYASPDEGGGAAPPYELASLSRWPIETICRRLAQEGWGRYLLVGKTAEGAAVFRDPSGALDCFTWTARGLRMFAARLPTALDPLLPRSASIDWTRVARQLRDPPAVAGESALRNIETVAAGCLWRSGPGLWTSSERIWWPAEIACRRPPPGDPAERLRNCVRSSVATLTEPYSRLVAEISGGLDSAIVASALCLSAHRRPNPPAMRWINYATDHPEGDERIFARAVVARLGIDLAERRKPALIYSPDQLASLGRDGRVGLARLDPDYDLSLTAEAAAFSAQALVTGQGGDVVFLQMAADEVLADRLRVEHRLNLSELLAHCRRYRRSIWRMAATTLARAVWTAPPRRPVPDYLIDVENSRISSHPWLEDIDGLPAAKAIQIAALAGAQNIFGPAGRTEAVRGLHPLLSQPVVEQALSLPSFVLTHGGADRALARKAFAASLPDALLDRRSKGSLQAFYGRAVADSLDVLRPWLLEGVLARERLIRVDRLEPLLDPDVLILRNIYIPILHVVAMEAWVRGWTDRIADIRSQPPLRQG